MLAPAPATEGYRHGLWGNGGSSARPHVSGVSIGKHKGEGPWAPVYTPNDEMLAHNQHRWDSYLQGVATEPRTSVF